MGVLDCLRSLWRPQNSYRILMVSSARAWAGSGHDSSAFRRHTVSAAGISAAGKTTILYKIKLGEVVTTISTITFNVVEIKMFKVSFTAWDVSGR